MRLARSILKWKFELEGSFFKEKYKVDQKSVDCNVMMKESDGAKTIFL